MANGTAFSSPLLDAGQVRKYAYRHRMGMVPSAEFCVFHDDFWSLFSANVATGWSADIIDTGATIITDNIAGHGTGVAVIGSDGTTEGAAMYTAEGFQLVSGKKMFIEVRVKTSDADDTDVQFGLTDVSATTNPEDVWTTASADLVAFGVLDGDATVKMLSDNSNSGSTAETGTIDLSDATWHTLAIYYDGTNLHGYVDGERALTWAQASTTIPNDGVTLAAFIGGRTGGDAAHEVYFDYIRLVSER